MYDQNKDLDLTRFLYGLLRYKKMGLMVFSIMLTITIFGNDIMFPDKYETKSTVRFQSNAFEDDRNNRESVLREEILSRSNLIQVVEKLKMTDLDQSKKSGLQNVLGLVGIKTKIKDVNVDSLVRWLSTAIIIEQAQNRGQTDIFTLSLTDDDPEEIANIVNAVVQTYIDSQHNSKSETLHSRVAFLKKQIELKRNDLNDAETTLLKFKDKNADLLSRSDSIAQAIQQLRQAYITAKSRFLEVSVQLSSAETVLKSTNPYVGNVSHATLDESQLSPEELYYKVKGDLTNALYRFTPQHPVVISLKSKLQQLENDVGSNPVIKVGSSSNPEYQRVLSEVHAAKAAKAAATEELKLLESEISALEDELKIIPNINAKMNKLQVNATNLHDEYDSLRNQLRQNIIRLNASDDDKIGSNFSVIDKASVPTVTVFGSRTKYYVMGLILSLFAGVGIILAIVVIFNKSTEGLTEEISNLKENTSPMQNIAFYGTVTLILMINVGYIVSQKLLENIVIV